MKNILLAVTGLSPQVITETLYALNQVNRPVHAVHVITTRYGKERIFTDLLAGGRGYFFQFIQEYSRPEEAIVFGPEHVYVIRDENGREIEDVEQESDNVSLLRKCLELSCRFTNDPDTAVFFSVAGGRKTMSSCLALAAQIYGRPQDRLYHVLVSPEFENSPNFFYPPKPSKSIQLTDRSGNPYLKETRFAQVNLIHIPFFSVRDRMAPELLEQPQDPGTLLLSLVREDRDRLVVDLSAKKITYKGIELDLMPAWMALYAFFAFQKTRCIDPKPTCRNCIDCFIDLQTIFGMQHEITDIYRRICGSRPIEEMSDSGIVSLSGENFRAYKGKIKRELEIRFGPEGMNKLEIASEGRRGDMRYGIRLDKGAIELLA